MSSKIGKTSGDTILVSVRFHHVPNAQLTESFWETIDENALDPGTRRAWLANGMRVGVAIPATDLQLGNDVSRIFEDPITSLLAGVDVLGGQSGAEEKIPLRPSQRHELPMGPGIEGEAVVLVSENGEVIGQQLQSPQLTLDLVADYASQEGRAEFSIHPVIQHGPIRQKFIGSDAAVRIHASRDAWSLPEMDIELESRVGTTLVIAPVINQDDAEPTFALGHQMLRDTEHMQGTRCIVCVIRVLRITTPHAG